GLDPIGMWMVSSSPQDAHESAYHSACGRAERSSTCNPGLPPTGHDAGASGLSRPAVTAASASRNLLGGRPLPFISLIQCPSNATSAWHLTPLASSLPSPPRSGRSITKAAPTTSPPERRTSLAA